MRTKKLPKNGPIQAATALMLAIASLSPGFARAGTDAPAPAGPPPTAPATATTTTNSTANAAASSIAKTSDSGKRTSTDAPVGVPNSVDAPITPTQGGDPVANFVKNTITSLGAGPILNPGAEIDRIVGDPWTLNPSTAAKLDSLPSKFRLQMYSVLAGMQPEMKMIPATSTPSLTSQPATSGTPPLAVTMSSDATQRFVNEVMNRLGNYFTTEELLDLGVYYLSKQPFFPKDLDGWNKVKNEIAANGVWLALGVLAAEAAGNNLSIGVSGKIVQLAGGGFRLGWYGSIRDFGFSLTPTLREGVTVNTKYFETSSGLVEHIGAAPGTEKIGAEFFVREHVLDKLAKPAGWDVGVYANAHYLIMADPLPANRVSAEVDAYARKDHFLAKDPVMAFLASGAFATDFEHTTSTRINLGLDNPRYDLAAGLTASYNTDTSKPGHPALVGGFFLGGSLESHEAMVQGQMNSSAGIVRTRLDYFRRMQKIQDDVRAKLKLFGTGALKPFEENELIRQYLDSEPGIAKARESLQAAFASYLGARNRYYHLQGRSSRDDLTDLDGPLSPEDMQATRLALGSQQRFKAYTAPATGQSPNLPPQASSNVAVAPKADPVVARQTWGAPSPGQVVTPAK